MARKRRQAAGQTAPKNHNLLARMESRLKKKERPPRLRTARPVQCSHVNYENVDQSIGIEFLDFDLVWEEFAGLKIRRLVVRV